MKKIAISQSVALKSSDFPLLLKKADPLAASSIRFFSEKIRPLLLKALKGYSGEGSELVHDIRPDEGKDLLDNVSLSRDKTKVSLPVTLWADFDLEDDGVVAQDMYLAIEYVIEDLRKLPFPKGVSLYYESGDYDKYFMYFTFPSTILS